MKRFLFLSLISTTATLLVVACCGGTAATTPATGSNNLSGQVSIDGSITVVPIIEVMAEESRSVAPDVRITVGVSGTGGGFKNFCAGEADISDAARGIKDSEREVCVAAGIELRVGLDGLAVLTNRENDFLPDGITSEQFHTIFGPNTDSGMPRSASCPSASARLTLLNYSNMARHRPDSIG
jgi:phosphate transport system substrate-binding protein